MKALRDSTYSGLPGKFIVLDGPDGGGKTTVRGIIAEHLRENGLCVTECKDPGGTVIGNRIRSVLLDFDLTQMDVRCETLLFMASRAQLLREAIRPALTEGQVVICDRFVSATCAYQLAAGFDFDATIQLAEFAVDTCWPDLTLILDVGVEMGLARCRRRAEAASIAPQRPSGLDSMERRPKNFHEAVRANFLELPQKYPSPVEILDASGPVEDVVRQVLARLSRLGSDRASKTG